MTCLRCDECAYEGLEKEFEKDGEWKCTKCGSTEVYCIEDDYEEQVYRLG